ncbi:hypothetical protein D3Z55_05390 [Clostridiaceae bacterium]|nr:substrate-binding domain-containing protein [Lachnospiraceae bacterium]NBH16920.1 hypothetical protein [Clostridiaceae bacterium]
MMSRKEKMLWIFYGLILVLLFLLSSTDLIIKEKETQVYAISVIIEDSSDDNYVNFRKGMDRAAIDLNADVSFITLYDKGNRIQQEELILREQQDGSRVLIVSPVDAGKVLALLEDKRVSVPLILLNSEAVLTGEGISERIGFDYFQMGQELAEQIHKDSLGQRVCLIGERKPDSVSIRFRDGILSVLKPLGYDIRFLEGRSPEEWEKAFKQMKMEDGILPVAVALDPESLLSMAVKLTEQEAEFETETGNGEASGKDKESMVLGLYGRGNTVRLLNYLDKGMIQGLSITDDFSAGYLSVKMAVDLAENRIVEDVAYLESRCIRREDLRRKEYEKMLYPIE